MSLIVCRVFVLVALIATLAGCATLAGRPVDAASADALYAQGDFRGAAAEYQRLARTTFGAAREPLLLRSGESLREEGDLAGAASAIAPIQRKRLDGGQAQRFDLLNAEIALAAGDAARALALTGFALDALRPRDAARAAELRARAFDATAQPIEAAAARVALLALVAPRERKAIEGEIGDRLARVEPATLNAALATLPRGDARRPYIERALRAQGEAPARVLGRGTRAVGLLANDPAAEIWAREGRGSETRVALLLPLSGELAPAGNAILDGFMAAYFDEPEGRPDVRVFDSGATAESALAAYQKAAADGSRRIVGPLVREQVAAIFGQAELPVPVLALNHTDDGAPPPAGSQLFGLLPDEEAAFVAELALTRGARRAAILASAEDWGLRAAQAFRAQFVQGGGVVSGEARVASGSIEVMAAIDQALAGGADLVFIALRPQAARVAVPQLKLRDTSRAIVATSHVYSGVTVPTLDRDLDGVVFCDAPWLFDLNSGFSARAALAGDLASAQGNPRLFAFGIDAFRLLGYIDWLARNPDDYLPGASGDLAVDEFGRVRRSLACLQFVDGSPRSVDGALTLSTP